jgi:hypothetical protein
MRVVHFTKQTGVTCINQKQPEMTVSDHLRNVKDTMAAVNSASRKDSAPVEFLLGETRWLLSRVIKMCNDAYGCSWQQHLFHDIKPSSGNMAVNLNESREGSDESVISPVPLMGSAGMRIISQSLCE